MRLFEPNNHSQWQIRYRAVDDMTAACVREVVARQYNTYIDTLISIEQVDEAEVNSNNFKLTGTSNGTPVVYLLRRSPLSRPIEEVVHVHEIMNATRAMGVPTPVALLGTNGLISEEVDGRYVLYEFIEAPHYRGTWEELVDCGVVVGKLDAALATVAPRYTHEPSLRFSPEYIEARRFDRALWDDIIERSKTRSEAAELVERASEVYDTLEYLDAHAPATSEVGLVHFDLHPHNYLADGTTIRAVLDFDSLRYVERMRAFAFALHRAIRQYVIYTNPQDPIAEAKKAKEAFVAAYRSEYALSDEELASLPYFIKHEALSRLTYSMKDFLATGVMVWKFDIPKQLAAMAEADIFI